ncbi:hypothetical protein FE633_10050 [Streptomyces montanus]|uniref:Uncharacterized protein n=1 Tax=Streptomyces montanus TaxID=2580423 RepID=A0A5R9G3W6_9ACTN|nr:hypothetical protein [Streptomyces montanus]TLS46275.1 hypothetical protein FE633_10050 [Streptomyces montanus]
MASEDEQSVDDMFAELPEDGRRTLEQIGMGLPELRRMAAGEGGMRQVRGILSEFTAKADPRQPGGDEGPAQRTAVWPWLRLLLAAVAGFVVCELSTLVLGGVLSLLVGVLCGVGVIFAALGTRESRGGLVLRWLMVAAYYVLIFVASYTTQEWYMQLRGVEQTVTITAPSHQWAHGTRQTYCRVRLPDGSVHQVFRNREDCADRVGAKSTAVVDSSGRFRPFLGSKSDIGDTAETAVSLGAAAVLVLAPAGAVAMGRVPPVRRSRNDRASGTAA